MKRVMEFLSSLIQNEVQKKTCVSLSPDMREFLGWMLQVDREKQSLEEVCFVILQCVSRPYANYYILFCIF